MTRPRPPQVSTAIDMNRRFKSVTAYVSSSSSSSSAWTVDDGVADVVVGGADFHRDRLQRGVEVNRVPLDAVTDEVVVVAP